MTTTDPNLVTTNEIDPDRLAILQDQGFGPWDRDASTVITDNPELAKSFDAVVANPPFGKIPKTTIDGFEINRLDHKIMMDALKGMKDDGKAAFIIGGHTWEPGQQARSPQNG